MKYSFKCSLSCSCDVLFIELWKVFHCLLSFLSKFVLFYWVWMVSIHFFIPFFHKKEMGGFLMEQLPLNGFVRSLFDGYKAGKQKGYYPNRFNEMSKTNRLFEVDEINEMLENAEDKEDYETILDHMYRFNATDAPYGYYKRIEKKIINQFWED